MCSLVLDVLDEKQKETGDRNIIVGRDVSGNYQNYIPLRSVRFTTNKTCYKDIFLFQEQLGSCMICPLNILENIFLLDNI